MNLKAYDLPRANTGINAYNRLKTHQNYKRWNISLQNKLIKAEKILLDYDDDVNNKSIADKIQKLN